MIRRDLVPLTKMLDDAVMVPLALVELTVDDLPLTVEAALSDILIAMHITPKPMTS